MLFSFSVPPERYKSAISGGCLNVQNHWTIWKGIRSKKKKKINRIKKANQFWIAVDGNNKTINIKYCKAILSILVPSVACFVAQLAYNTWLVYLLYLIWPFWIASINHPNAYNFLIPLMCFHNLRWYIYINLYLIFIGKLNTFGRDCDLKWTDMKAVFILEY